MTIFREKFKTLKNVFDLFTEKSIFKLASQGYFEGLESPITLGKEANIFTARTREGKRVIVKIYRLTTCDFKQMYSYIRADPRFPRLPASRRKVIFAWCQREFRNLLLAREAGVRVPTPLAAMHNILVMEYIGNDDPAPRLIAQEPQDPASFYTKVLQGVRMLHDANIVHGDLSPFNILIYRERPVFIDMSQATTFDNPNASEYLKRDVKNVCQYFVGLGVDADPGKALLYVTRKKTKL